MSRYFDSRTSAGRFDYSMQFIAEAISLNVSVAKLTVVKNVKFCNYFSRREHYL